MITSEELLMKFIKGEKNSPEEITFTERTTAISQYCRYLKAMDTEPAEIETLLDSLRAAQGELYLTNTLFYKVYFKFHYTEVSSLELKEVFDEDLTAVWLPHKISLGYSCLNRMLDSPKPKVKAEISHLVELLESWITERDTNPDYEEFR